jgi:WbqC-like protein family
MRLGIMQPYFFPYLGYFQLMNAVDQYVLYDNIEYTKKGWINRNRILLNGQPHIFTLPLKKDSDFLSISQRSVASDSGKEIGKILGQIKASYCKAPHFKTIFPLVEQVFLFEDRNLFKFIFNSITRVREYLNISTPIHIASEIDIDHSLKGKNKVMAICKQLHANVYINPIGGTELYDVNVFGEGGILLKFHSMNDISYKQNGNDFVQSLSIIDVMMFNSRDEINLLLNEYLLT